MKQSIPNTCSSCCYLVDAEKPYYCALLPLYTLKMAEDKACEEYKNKNSNEQRKRNHHKR